MGERNVSGRAQASGSDELGWLLDLCLAHREALGTKMGWCPKAILRAHARLLTERASPPPPGGK